VIEKVASFSERSMLSVIGGQSEERGANAINP